MIDNYFASVGNKGLGLVDVQYIESPRVKDLVDDLELSLVHHVALAPGDLGEGCLRDVILGRSEASGSDDYLIGAQFVCQVVNDLVAGVSDREHPCDLDSYVLKGGGDVR